jgi:hypothetical protein
MIHGHVRGIPLSTTPRLVIVLPSPSPPCSLGSPRHLPLHHCAPSTFHRLAEPPPLKRMAFLVQANGESLDPMSASRPDPVAARSDTLDPAPTRIVVAWTRKHVCIHTGTVPLIWPLLVVAATTTLSPVALLPRHHRERW